MSLSWWSLVTTRLLGCSIPSSDSTSLRVELLVYTIYYTIYYTTSYILCNYLTTVPTYLGPDHVNHLIHPEHDTTEITIGRSSACNMVLDYRTVSTSHAKMTLKVSSHILKTYTIYIYVQYINKYITYHTYNILNTALGW
jgi:hypothetical protein